MLSAPEFANDDIVGFDKQHPGEDVSNLESINAFIKKHKPEYVIHLAANPDPSASREDIDKNNRIGTKNLYEAAFKNAVKRVVFASSTHLIGGYKEYPKEHPASGLFTIDTPYDSDSNYGESKVYGEMLAGKYAKKGMESVCIRVGAVPPDDIPYAPYEKLWLSHRDVAQVFMKALFAKIPNGFGIYYASSEIPGPVVNIEPTIRDLGYKPQDRLKI